MPHLEVIWRLDLQGLLRTYVFTVVMWSVCQAMDVARSTTSRSISLQPNTIPPSELPTSSRLERDKELVCCSGVLGFASDNVSLNFPCQDRPCCNASEIQAVVPVDMAMGFRFQCMPHSSVHLLCYESGSEVRTSNQDPDFIPRACCQGLKFHVQLNHWYAALVVKCVDRKADNS